MTTTGPLTVPAVKICGVCHPSDAAHATAAGASYIGVILSPGYSRSRTAAEADAIWAAAGGARRAGVFVDATAAEVIAATTKLKLDVVQLHGHEPVGMIEQIRAAVPCEVWKAVRIGQPGDLADAATTYGAADALLLEGKAERGIGGTGAGFDWGAVVTERNLITTRVVVAGGLTPDNVAAMIAVLRPDVVDVSSGVEERGSGAGRKSSPRVSAFLAAARSEVQHE